MLPEFFSVNSIKTLATVVCLFACFFFVNLQTHSLVGPCTSSATLNNNQYKMLSNRCCLILYKSNSVIVTEFVYIK